MTHSKEMNRPLLSAMVLYALASILALFPFSSIDASQSQSVEENQRKSQGAQGGGEIYIGLMDARHVYSLSQNPNGGAYFWSREDLLRPTSPKQLVGIAPVGFLRDGKYHPIEGQAGGDIEHPLLECDSIKDRVAVSACYLGIAKTIYGPGLSVSAPWFFDGVQRVPSGAALSGSDRNRSKEALWKNVVLLVRPFWWGAGSNEDRVPSAINADDYVEGDVLSTNSRARAYPFYSNDDAPLSGLKDFPMIAPAVSDKVWKAATQRWIQHFSDFEGGDLEKVEKGAQQQYRLSADHAREQLKKISERGVSSDVIRNPGVVPAEGFCISTPRDGRYSMKLFFVSGVSAAPNGNANDAEAVEPFDVDSIGEDEYHFTAIVWADGSGVRVLRDGIAVRDEIFDISSCKGSELETPQGDFLVYHESGVFSPSKFKDRISGQDNGRPIRVRGDRPIQQFAVIDKVQTSGVVSREGLLRGTYGPPYDQIPLGK